MNNARRKRIKEAVAKLEEIQEELNQIWDEEQEAYENLPESIQLSEKGESMSDGLDTFEQSQGSLQEAIDGLNELV